MLILAAVGGSIVTVRRHYFLQMAAVCEVRVPVAAPASVVSLERVQLLLQRLRVLVGALRGRHGAWTEKRAKRAVLKKQC